MRRSAVSAGRPGVLIREIAWRAGESECIGLPEEVSELLGFYLGHPAHERQAVPGAWAVRGGESEAKQRALWYVAGEQKAALLPGADTHGGGRSPDRKTKGF